MDIEAVISPLVSPVMWLCSLVRSRGLWSLVSLKGVVC